MARSEDVIAALKQKALPEKAQFYPKFFRAYPGGYGEGDQFLGVVVPEQRKLATRFRELRLPQVKKLLSSRWHEGRLTGLFILVDQFSRSKDANERERLVRFYLSQLDQVNNWDLVDATAHKILGQHLLESHSNRQILRTLAGRSNLWHQRVSVIATLPLIKQGEFSEILWLAEHFLTHEHDLIHKAVGWMLRELGKVELEPLRSFLKQYSSQMPRTMLRYSIEKLSPAEHRKWLQR